MDLEGTIERYHVAADDFARGNPEPVKALFSHADDVMLANPFGPARRGWADVSSALDYASSRFSDGAVTGVERIATYANGDLAAIHETEHWEAKVGERSEPDTFDLRVTTTFRLEDGSWKLVHRHADPIAAAHPDGPVRTVER